MGRRGSVRTDKKRRPSGALLITKPGLLRRLLCHPALVPGGSIGVNESLAGGAIEELHRGELFRRIGFGRMRFLQCGSERRALGAIARHRCTGLTHVLFCGRNIRHSRFSGIFVLVVSHKDIAAGTVFKTGTWNGHWVTLSVTDNRRPFLVRTSDSGLCGLRTNGHPRSTTKCGPRMNEKPGSPQWSAIVRKVLLLHRTSSLARDDRQ